MNQKVKVLIKVAGILGYCIAVVIAWLFLLEIGLRILESAGLR